MPVVAPLRIPVELRLGARRWFRYAVGVSERGVAFARALPEELDGAVEVAFQLPDDAPPIHLRGRTVADEDAPRPEGPAERRAVRFIALDEPSRARIARYVEERVPA